MRQLFPTVEVDVDPDAVYATDERRPHASRPWVIANFVSSLDGAIAVDGRSGPLGGPADKRVFRSIRAVADVILVGAGTVRAENYGPPALTEELRSQRQARGQTELPRIAVVTASLNLDFASRLFADPELRPIVITDSVADPDLRDRAGDVADVVVTASDNGIDLAVALDELHKLGAEVVLCEGGPTLAGQLAAAGLVDELCLTLSGALVGGTSPRVLNGPTLNPIQRMTLARIIEADGLLFLRHVRADS